MKQFVRKAPREDMLELAGLVNEGRLTPLVDCVYPLTDAAAAMEYLLARHPRGKVIVTP